MAKNYQHTLIMILKKVWYTFTIILKCLQAYLVGGDRNLVGQQGGVRWGG